MTYKVRLHEFCLEEVESRLILLQTRIDETREALHSESKSTAGDKHETGRAMAQLEMEKLGHQHQAALKLKQLLLRIHPDQVLDRVLAGSLVETDKGWFYLSIGLGKVEFEGKEIFVLSPAAPLAQALLNKKKEASVPFNSATFHIKNCS